MKNLPLVLCILIVFITIIDKSQSNCVSNQSEAQLMSYAKILSDLYASGGGGGTNNNTIQECTKIIAEITMSFENILNKYKQLYNVSGNFGCQLSVKNLFEEKTKTMKKILDDDLWKRVNDQLEFSTKIQTALKLNGLRQTYLKVNTNTTSTIINIVKLVNSNELKRAVEEYGLLDRTYLMEIIREILGQNMRNGEKVIQFLDLLPRMEETHLGYKYLYQDLIRYNATLSIPAMILSYRVLTIPNNLSLSPTSANTFAYIKNNIPYGVSIFPFNQLKPVGIMSTKYDEVFYASNSTRDVKRRKTYLSYEYRRMHDDDEEGWSLLTENNGFTFKIKPNYYPGYLYAETKEYALDENRRSVFVGEKMEPGLGEWQFEPVGDGSFKIKNLFWNEYLKAGDRLGVGKDLRMVITRIRGGCGDDACKWRLMSFRSTRNL